MGEDRELTVQFLGECITLRITEDDIAAVVEAKIRQAVLDKKDKERQNDDK